MMFLTEKCKPKFNMGNKEKVANIIDGRKRGKEVTLNILQEASNNNLIIIYGKNDDLMEIRGAVNLDHISTGGTALYAVINSENNIFVIGEHDFGAIKKARSMLDFEMPEFEVIEMKKVPSKRIELNEGYINPSWLVYSKIPYAEFDIMDGKEIFCRGAVIDVNEILDHLTKKKKN